MHFRYRYDYTVQETEGLRRAAEPIEVTLSAKDGEIGNWQEEVRVLRVEASGSVEPIPFQAHGRLIAKQPDAETPKTESANIVFIASCPANGTVTYSLLWGRFGEEPLPSAPKTHEFNVEGDIPGLRIENRHYAVELSPKNGAILNARRGGKSTPKQIDFFQKIPIHFVADVWSPPQRWDHDYDWNIPPNQEFVHGPVFAKYHRWGPMSLYNDVIAHLTYTFYADVPYIAVSAMLEFTENRSVHAVRLGEIVTTHLESKERESKREEKLVPVFTHYAWPRDEGVAVREIEPVLDEERVAQVDGYEPGALAILQRDIPWVAAYHRDGGYGIAALRKSRLVMNKYGGPLPHTVPCVYLGQYGWGFSYWSKPEVYPFGARQTPLDRNTVVSRGTLFAGEEALFIFKPSSELKEIRETSRRYLNPLRLKFKGTGPW